MKLLYSPTSPYARKAYVLLMETGQTDDVELVQTSANPLNSPAEVIAANPVGKIPALIREGQTTLYDSRVICQFLNDRAGADLYAQGDRWELMTLEATADAIMDAALLMVFERRLRTALTQDEAWVEAQWTKIERAVAALNADWMAQLSGPLNIGQIAVGCALGYVDFRLNERNWRKGNDALDDWYAAFSERPSMAVTIPAG